MLLCEPPPPVVPSGVDAPVRTRSLPEAVDCDPEWVVRKWVCAGNSAVTSWWVSAPTCPARSCVGLALNLSPLRWPCDRENPGR